MYRQKNSNQSGFEVGHTFWPILHIDPQNNPDTTHTSPTCDPNVEVFFLKVANATVNEKILIWNNAQISSFLAGYRTGSLYKILEDEIFGYHMLQTSLR